MSGNQDELFIDENEEGLSPSFDDKLTEMRDFDYEFTARAPAEVGNQTLTVLKRIPVFSSLISSLDGSAGSLSRFAEITGRATVTTQAVGHSMQYVSIGVDAINFLLVPVMYAVAWYYDEKLPFKLSDKAKWLYSAVILGLAIASAATSGVVAGALVGTIVGLGAVASISTFAILVKDIRQHYKKIKELDKAITQAENELEEILQDIQREDLSEEYVDYKYHAYLAKKNSIQDLYDQRLEEQTQVKAKDGLHMLDTGVGMGFAMIAGIGAILTIKAIGMVTAGYVVLAATGALGFTYMTGRILSSLVPEGFKSLARWWNKSRREINDVVENTLDNSSENELENTISQETPVLLGTQPTQEQTVVADLKHTASPETPILLLTSPRQEQTSEFLMHHLLGVQQAHSVLDDELSPPELMPEMPSKPANNDDEENSDGESEHPHL